jgi:hypothetical protein
MNSFILGQNAIFDNFIGKSIFLITQWKAKYLYHSLGAAAHSASPKIDSMIIIKNQSMIPCLSIAGTLIPVVVIND